MSVSQSIADIRKVYQKRSLSEKDVKDNPIEQFKIWWEDALASTIDDVNAMTLATSTLDGKPSARIVLLKGIENDGFVFFTNYESRKSREIEANPSVALLFYWRELERQVRIEGGIQKINAADSDEYFHSRPHESQIGAWVSPQSQIIPGRDFLETRRIKTEEDFQGKNVDRPPFWGGFLVRPVRVEFWQGRPGRLHDRIAFIKDNDTWSKVRLAP